MGRIISLSVAAVAFAAICIAAEPMFDAPSVKVSRPDAPRPYTIAGGPATRDTRRFRASHISMMAPLLKAYGPQPDQIVAPSWIKESPPAIFYEIAVTMPADTTKEQLQKMLQRLLAERFHLSVHHETRLFPATTWWWIKAVRS